MYHITFCWQTNAFNLTKKLKCSSNLFFKIMIESKIEIVTSFKIIKLKKDYRHVQCWWSLMQDFYKAFQKVHRYKSQRSICKEQDVKLWYRPALFSLDQVHHITKSCFLMLYGYYILCAVNGFQIYNYNLCVFLHCFTIFGDLTFSDNFYVLGLKSLDKGSNQKTYCSQVIEVSKLVDV